MELRIQDLILRTVTYDDINEVARTWVFKEGGISKEEAKKKIDWMKNTRMKNKHHHIAHICLAVFEGNSKKIIGWCGLDGGYGVNKNRSIIALFYMIDKKYRNKGYATLCAKKLLEYGFMEMKVNRIDGGCAKENIASKKVLEKIGMKNKVISKDGSFSYHLSLEEYKKANEVL